MTPSKYAEYEAAVAEFFEIEGIVNLTIDTDCYHRQQGIGPDDDPTIEPYFSWSWCVACSRPTGGDRYDATGYSPTKGKSLVGYSVCPDCIYYAEYGCLDDQTMLAIAQ